MGWVETRHTRMSLDNAVNVEQAIEKMVQPSVKYKTPWRKAKERIVHKTGKPAFSYNGLINPIKLNISQDTLKVLTNKK